MMKTPIDFKPFAYQRDMINFLATHQQACLFAGCGLGKSVSTLYAFDWLRKKSKVKAMLIVSPLRVTNLTWPAEVAKWSFSKDLKVANLRTKAGQIAYQNHAADIYLINYESLHKIENVGAFDLVVFDELSKAKNPSSKRINDFRKRFDSVQARWGLTGTPMPNGHLDLFAQYRLIDEGVRLGHTEYQFKNRYFESDYMGYTWTLKNGAGRVIEDLVADVTCIMKSSDHLNIPDTHVIDHDVTMPATARKLYNELKKEFFILIEDSEVVSPSAGVLVNKLKQVTGGNVYAYEDDETKEGRHVVKLHDAKIKALQKLIKDTDAPLLIAASYKHEIAEIVAATGAREWRDDLLDDWNAGKVEAIVAHPMSIGHGLNLQRGSHHLCWYSLDYSSELYDQFNARLARTGQDSETFVHRLIVKDSVDEAIVEALRNKDNTQNAFLEAMKRLS